MHAIRNMYIVSSLSYILAIKFYDHNTTKRSYRIEPWVHLNTIIFFFYPLLSCAKFSSLELC